MAARVALQVEESSLRAGQKARFLLTVTNPDSDAVTLNSLQVSTSPAGAAANVKLPAVTPTSQTQINGSSSTLPISFGGVFFAQPTPTTATTEQTGVTVQVVARLSDGVAVSNAVTMQITPTIGEGEGSMPYPRGGQLSFDSNNNALRWFNFGP